MLQDLEAKVKSVSYKRPVKHTGKLMKTNNNHYIQ